MFRKVCSDVLQEEELQEEKKWQLLKDTKKLMDTSTAGLGRLFRIFYDASPSNDQSFIGPRFFKLALLKHGVTDRVLISRLFNEFQDEAESERIDYRVFLRVLASVNDEPVEDRLSMLFEVWDIDRSLTLSYSELGQIMVHGISTEQMEAVTERFNRVWVDIRSSLAEESDDQWIGPSRSSGVTKEDLTNACKQYASVRDFFNKMLTKRSAKADDRHRVSFAARLRELEAEVLKEQKRHAAESAAEVKAAASIPSSLPRSSSTPGRLGRSTSSSTRVSFGGRVDREESEPPKMVRGTTRYKQKASAVLNGNQRATGASSSAPSLPAL